MMQNGIEFKVWGRFALFTDPITKIGGEKCSYHVPTYEALKGVAKSIYWKPSIIWIIDEVRVMRRIQTQMKGVKPLSSTGGRVLFQSMTLQSITILPTSNIKFGRILNGTSIGPNSRMTGIA